MGFVETLGLTTALEAADAMVKSARVRLYRRRQPGAGLTLILCVGELADCQVAVAAGAAAAAGLGELQAAHVIARPGSGLADWLTQATPFNAS
ncbi:BMC domain-containing protein [Exilibacterium tricleocarpae]|uniref:BMC domain-containing protein n=1 Tax=Exilibacterium tricleocarpae TaxID=2591008 RepID=UPI003CCC4DBB